MKNTDSHGHVSGRSVYVDDIPARKGTLYAVVYASPLAHGKIRHIDYSAVAELDGVEAILTATDIPGENQIGGIIPDEPLFADGTVHFMGQPIALVVARTESVARRALGLIKADIEPLEVITDSREAYRRGQLLMPPRSFRSGDIAQAWEACAHVFEGRTESGGQEHLYIETQGSYAYPVEDGGVHIHSSTQGPTAVQKTVSRVLNLPMHRVEVDVTRLGGGFGGKEDQATGFACMAALGAHKLNRPVRLILHRLDDMKMTGKRHPYSADFRIGLSKDLKILAYEVKMFQNAGAAADLSPAILDRSLFHALNCYFIPHTKITAYSCKTNLPPNTAFRGFGGPQGMFIIESAIAKAAHMLGVPAHRIQEANLLKEGDTFHYGQIARGAHIGKAWQLASERFQLSKLEEEVVSFNNQHDIFRKGLAVMPICFGISFTNKSMNQARALVHIYQDGSIGVSTGAVEMGQGVNTKMQQVVSRVFSIRPERVKLASTNTFRIANTSPTAASSGADLNGKAAEMACEALKQRLLRVAANLLDVGLSDISLEDEWVMVKKQQTQLHWDQLVEKAHLERVGLSEHAHYATPHIHFDPKTAKGHPFAYHVYGVSLIEVTLDCLRGTYVFDKALMVHDFGNSLNPDIDLGQAEGALMQGIGWMTMEEVSYSSEGRLLSNSLSTYKIPDIYSAPHRVECLPLDVPGPELAIMRSKAVGEPPFMYGIGAFFALQNAIKAFNPAYEPDFDAPLTPEKVLMRLYARG